MIKKYLKFSWKEKNKEVKSIIGILFDEKNGFIKVRWLDRSALPIEAVSLVKYIIENDLGVLKEKYIPSSHCQIIERYGSSGSMDLLIIKFPYEDFEDYGYVTSEKIHVSMYKRLNETIIYEGNVYNLIVLLERLQRLIKEESFEDITKNLNVKEFTPLGESLRKKHNYEEDDKF